MMLEGAVSPTQAARIRPKFRIIGDDSTRRKFQGQPLAIARYRWSGTPRFARPGWRSGGQHRKSARKQGSLAVYQYLKQEFGDLGVDAAQHGLLIFGEHTQDARNRPGAHPNIDRLLTIVDGGEALKIVVI
jgi:hypothetical protein